MKVFSFLALFMATTFVAAVPLPVELDAEQIEQIDAVRPIL